jgi:hypothetical protein
MLNQFYEPIAASNLGPDHRRLRMERPKLLEIEKGDTNYQKGFKDGVWQQMQVQESLQEAMKPAPCMFHIYELHGTNCVRCGSLRFNNDKLSDSQIPL